MKFSKGIEGKALWILITVVLIFIVGVVVLYTNYSKFSPILASLIARLGGVSFGG